MQPEIIGEAVAEMPFLAAWRELDSTLVATAMLQSRQPLRMLAEEAIERFLAACELCEAKPTDLIQAYGNAARLCFHNGQIDRAEHLLLAALDLCSDGWRVTGNVDWCGAALGPYTFLAKILVLRGQVAIARTIYDEIYAFLRDGTAFHLARLTFTREMWSKLTEQSKEFNQVRMHAAAVYMVETAKALLIARDFTGLMEFAETTASDLAISRASKRHTLGLAEIRAQALAGLGHYEQALTEYNRLRSMLPERSPGFIVLYAHAARVYKRVKGIKAAVDWLDRAEEELKNCGTGVESAVSRYHSHFAIGFERIALGDYVGCFRCASSALVCAREGDHTVGVMRARVLLNMSSAIKGHSPNVDSSEYDDAICQREIEGNLYGMESLAAQLHLASSQIARRDKESALRSLARAQQLSRILESWGMPLPDGLKIAGNYDSVIEAKAKTTLDDTALNHMYSALMLYAKETTPMSTAPASSSACAT